MRASVRYVSIGMYDVQRRITLRQQVLGWSASQVQQALQSDALADLDHPLHNGHLAENHLV